MGNKSNESGPKSSAGSDVAAKRYWVAKGRGVTCLRGTLGPGEEVFVSDFAGNGARVIETFLKCGGLTDKEPRK